MTDKEKLEANIACAKLLGYEVVEVATIERGECMVEMDILKIREFNIFTNASQCLEVVKKLGSREVWIASFVDGRNGLTRWFWDDGKDGSPKHYETYEEAVASAAIEVIK